MHYTKLRLQNSNLFFLRFVIFFFGKAKSVCKNYVVVGERKRKNPTRHHSSLLNQAQFFLEGKILVGKFGKSSSSQAASSFFGWESGAGWKEEICSFFSKGGLNFGKVWPNVLFSNFFQLNPRVFQNEIFCGNSDRAIFDDSRCSALFGPGEEEVLLLLLLLLLLLEVVGKDHRLRRGRGRTYAATALGAAFWDMEGLLLLLLLLELELLLAILLLLFQLLLLLE